MKVIITGSTKGIGRAMAKEFLRCGDGVIISSRSAERVAAVAEELKKEFPAGAIWGAACDVSRPADVDALARFGKEKFGTLDVWINNAGTDGHQKRPLAECTQEMLKLVIDTNLLGTVLCCRAALAVMLPQGCGHIFNFDGYGASGIPTPKLAAYGATKRAIPQLMATLVKETQGTGVGIHTISPGMVLTDLLIEGATPETAKVLNILTELPEPVAQFLVSRVRAVKGTGTYIQYLTKASVLWRFVTAWKRKNRFFNEQGRLIA